MRMWGERLRRASDRWLSPFTAPVPANVQGELVALQYERLVAALPMLCILIAANAVAMGLAVMGELPWWQQLAPPVIIVGTCLAVLWRLRTRPATDDPDAALRTLRRAPLVTVPLGLVAGFWCVNAFEETEKYYCMVAPVFIGIASLVSATCLLSVPRAAIGGMIATVVPIAIKMALFDNLGVRAMDAMMVLVTIMQARVVLSKFDETVRMLTLQSELNRLAGSDPLTGLDNRLAFDSALQRMLNAGEPVFVALADLDGFKQANDQHGHLAGDAILVEVARRMRRHAPQARSLARLGGDEFALLFSATTGTLAAEAQLDELRRGIGRAYRWQGSTLRVETSLGTALSLVDGTEPDLLLASADRRLYHDKLARKRAAALPSRLVTAA